MKTFLSLLLAVCAATMLTPKVSEAYFMTNQTAQKLTPSTALYTVTYRFGLPKNELRLPASTVRDLMHGGPDNRLGYTIRDDEHAIHRFGETAAVVFSSARLENGMYVVPAGESADFTLVAFFKGNSMTPTDDYKLQVEHLPFPTVLPGGNLQTRSLNPTEVDNYVTDTVPVN